MFSYIQKRHIPILCLPQIHNRKEGIRKMKGKYFLLLFLPILVINSNMVIAQVLNVSAFVTVDNDLITSACFGDNSSCITFKPEPSREFKANLYYNVTSLCMESNRQPDIESLRQQCYTCFNTQSTQLQSVINE